MIGTGIEFRLVYCDEDIVEYRFTCSNGKFCGQTEAYLGHGDIFHLIEGLREFPSKTGDSRKFELGNFDPTCAGGGMRLHFSRLDSAGHSAVDVELRTDGHRDAGIVQSVAMRIPIELASLDEFISELRAIELNIGANAHLRMAR